MADVKVRPVGKVAPTSGTTQDFTFSGMGTPKGSLFYLSFATAAGTVTDHAMLLAGMTDGTTSLALAVMSQDATAASVTRRARDGDAVILVINPTTQAIVARAEFDSFITDGIRILWTDLPESGFLVTAALLGGADLACNVHEHTSSATLDGTATKSGLSFAPQSLIAFSARGGFVVPTALNTNHHLWWGFADNNAIDGILQGSWNTAWRDNVANPDAAAWPSYSYILRDLRAGTGGLPDVTGGALQITSFTSDGYISTLRINGGSAIVTAVMAISWGGARHWMGIVDSPTATGVQTYVMDQPFKPFAMFILASPSEFVFDAVENDSESGDVAGGQGIGVAVEPTPGASIVQLSSSVSHQAGVATANTASLTSSVAIDVMDGSKNRITASLSSFTGGGWKLNYTAVRSTARHQWFLIVGEDTLATFGATQGAPTAAFTAKQVLRVTIGATQGVPTAAFVAKQVLRATFAATQGVPTAAFQTRQVSRVTFAAAQSAPSAAFAAAQAFRFSFLAAQGVPSALFQVLAAQVFQASFAATQGAPSAALSALQVFRATIGATQGVPVASFQAIHVFRVSFGAAQGAPTASLTAIQLLRASFGATQGAPVASLAALQIFRSTFVGVQGAPTTLFTVTSTDSTLAGIAAAVWARLVGPASAKRTLETILSMFLRKGSTIENLNGTKSVKIFDADQVTTLTEVLVSEDGLTRELVTYPTSPTGGGTAQEVAIAQAVWDYPIFDGLAAGVVLDASLAMFLREAVIVVNLDGSRTVTIYDLAGTTPVFQLLISADGFTRTRTL